MESPIQPILMAVASLMLVPGQESRRLAWYQSSTMDMLPPMVMLLMLLLTLQSVVL